MKYKVTAKVTVERPGKPKSRIDVETTVDAETREGAISEGHRFWRQPDQFGQAPRISRMEARAMNSPASMARARR